jgi:diguanylate cyclase (GGDEF)-like protein
MYKKIIVIDSNLKLADRLLPMASDDRFRMVFASSGREALAVLEKKPADVVVINTELSDGSGLGFLGTILERRTEAAAVVISGKPTIETASEAIALGADSFLTGEADCAGIMAEILRISAKKDAEQKILRQNRELRRANSELRTLYEISRALSLTLDPEELLAEVLRVLVRVGTLPFRAKAAIFLVDHDTLALSSFVDSENSGIRPCSSIGKGKCLCSRALATGEVVVSLAGEVEQLELKCTGGLESHGRIVVPLKAANKVVGILSLYVGKERKVSDRTIKLLSTIGAQIGNAINNARLYEETRSFSLHDPLTGLPNRRLMDIEVGKNFHVAERYGSDLSLIMLDIDFFKNFNDTYGHPEGDKLLRLVAEIMLKEVRTADYVFRYGGEEFLIMLPENNLEMSCSAAERLKRKIQEESGVTVSMGVSAMSPDIGNPSELIDRADKALYAAKQGGRNKVVAYSGKVPEIEGNKALST